MEWISFLNDSECHSNKTVFPDIEWKHCKSGVYEISHQLIQIVSFDIPCGYIWHLLMLESCLTPYNLRGILNTENVLMDYGHPFHSLS